MKKWTLLAFICAIFVMYTIDRALLGILADPIQRELGLDNLQFGVLSAAVFWTFPVCVPFAGMLGDRFNRAMLIGIAICAWSLMAMLGGFANGFWMMLIVISIAVTIPQTLFGPSATALIAEYHQATRTTALSVYQGAYYVGWFVSGAAVAAVLGSCGGWRSAYFVFGGLGLLLGLVFLGWGRGLTRSSSTAHRPSGGMSIGQSLLAFFGCRTALLVAAVYVVLTFIGCGYASWGPKFVAQKFGLSTAQAGTGVMFSHYAAALVGVLMAGFVTDRIVRRFPRCRLVMSAMALALSVPAMVVFGLSEKLWLVWGAAAWLGAMIGVVAANQFTSLFDVVPSRFRSGSVGFLNVFAGLLGSTAPIALGALSHRYGLQGFEIGFALMSIALGLGVISLVGAMFTFPRDRLVE